MPGQTSTGGSLLYLSNRDVEQTGLTEADILAELALLFAEKGAGRVDGPPKIGVHLSRHSFLHAMPAHVPGRRAVGMKWIGAFPGNRDRGIPQVNGIIVINDSETGVPVAVLDARWVTAKRTAAASALAARHLARPDACKVGILGCGVQGRSHLVALCGEFPIEEAVAYDPSDEARALYAEEMRDCLGIRVDPTAVPRDAVEGCDVVVTAGPIARPSYATVEAGWFSEGAFAAAVDYASAWSAGALARFDRIYTDDIPQLEFQRGQGYFPGLPEPFADLGKVVAGAKPGRTARTERLMACLLGLAAEDVVIGRLVVERAVAKGIGIRLPL
ncbi:MAG: ornithine cyclodeaminase family protein [Candidatus Bipolaricaulis sp.]|nr:ornithine cyclodeaminase family protein [Candidatus Bipolaricaulis sp.]